MTTGARASLTRSRSGVLLLLGQDLNSLGYGIATVALPWLVLDQGGSPSLAALVWAIEALPYLTSGLLAGAIADRASTRSVLVTGYVWQARPRS